MVRNRFLERISRCRAGLSVFDYLDTHVPSPVDYDDILRAQITNSISAFDTLIHDIIHDLMIESFLGKREQTKKFRSFSLPTSVVQEMFGDLSAPQEIFSKFVRSRLRKEAYQDPDKVTEGLALVWDENHKWQRVADLMNVERDYVVKKLKLAVIRRNAIVHESDFDPVSLELNPICRTDAEELVYFIETCGLAILQLALHTLPKVVNQN